MVIPAEAQNIPCIQSGLNDNFALFDPEVQGVTYYGSKDNNLLISCGNQVGK